MKRLITILALTAALASGLFAQATPKAWTTNFQLREYAQGANPGADSLNQNFIDIDTYIFAGKRGTIYPVTASLYDVGTYLLPFDSAYVNYFKGATLSLSGAAVISGAVTGGLYNDQTISSAANFTGTVLVNGEIWATANNGITFNGVVGSSSQPLIYYNSSGNYLSMQSNVASSSLQFYTGGQTLSLTLAPTTGAATFASTINSGAITVVTSSGAGISVSPSVGDALINITAATASDYAKIGLINSSRTWNIWQNPSTNLAFRDVTSSITALSLAGGTGAATFASTISSGAITSSGTFTINSTGIGLVDINAPTANYSLVQFQSGSLIYNVGTNDGVFGGDWFIDYNGAGSPQFRISTTGAATFAGPVTITTSGLISYFNGGNLSQVRNEMSTWWANNSANGESDLWHNAYYSSGLKRRYADQASGVQFIDGKIVFQTAGYGAADAAISWTNAATIDTTGAATFASTITNTGASNMAARFAKEQYGVAILYAVPGIMYNLYYTGSAYKFDGASGYGGLNYFDYSTGRYVWHSTTASGATDGAATLTGELMTLSQTGAATFASSGTFGGAVRSNTQEGFKLAASSGYLAFYEADGTSLNGYLQFVLASGAILQTQTATAITFKPGGTTALTLAPTTLAATFADDITLGGNQLDPTTKYFTNIGTLAKKYLTLHAAELWVETLVAQNTIATIGGRILVAPTTTLIVDMATDSLFIQTKHNNLASGDRVYLEADSKVEFMAVTSAAAAVSGGYRYSVTRDLDASGANVWYAGDAVLNTGTTGDGFIDLYSVSGVNDAAQYGPAIVGNIRTSATYSDWTEGWAIGNLNGLYGYSSDLYGAGFGKYDASSNYLTIDPTNGLSYYGTSNALLARLSGTTWTLGSTTTEHVNITSTSVQIKDGATVHTDLTAGALTLGDASNENVLINTSGVQLRDGATAYGAFAATTTIGATASEHVSITSTGVQLKDASTVLGHWSADSLVVGTASAGSNVKILSGGVSLRNYYTDIITLSSAGKATINSQASGQRMVITADTMSFYNSAGTNVGSLTGVLDGSTPTISVTGNLWQYGGYSYRTAQTGGAAVYAAVSPTNVTSAYDDGGTINSIERISGLYGNTTSLDYSSVYSGSIRKTFQKTAITDNSATGVFRIETTNETGSNDGGGYSVVVHAVVGADLSSASSDISVGSYRGTFTRGNKGDGTDVTSGVTNLSGIIGNDTGLPSIDALSMTVVANSDYQLDVKFTVDFGGGASAAQVTCYVELVWHGYLTEPLLSQL